MIRYLFFLLLLPCYLQAQQKAMQTIPFKATAIAARYYQGQVKQGKHWQDINGENLVLLTEVAVYWNNEEEGTRSGKLFAYHFIKADTGWKQIWKVQDNITECPVDVLCAFCKNSLSVTDIDKDGIPEITFVYLLSCKGGVDPDGKKLIMYEGSTKYAIRGTNILVVGKQGKQGGEKIIDKNFAGAPKVLLGYANKQWDKFGTIEYAL